MNENELKIHNIIWENLQFESSYLKKLKTLVDIYVSPFYNLIERGYFIELDMKLIVSNLKEMYFQCCTRWNSVILPFINNIKNGNQMKIEDLKNFYTIRKISVLGDDNSDLFQEEHIYHMTVDKLKDYINNIQKKNMDFNKFFRWVNKMLWSIDKRELSSYLTAPMHHLTRHTLFLERLIKSTKNSTSNASVKHREILETCLDRIKNFLKGVEAEICIRERIGILEEFENRIESYEYIDPIHYINEDLRKSIKISLKSPMAGCPEDWLRRFIKEGVVRIKECGRNQEVILCLFTDLLLICRKGRKIEEKINLKVYRPPMRLDVISVYPSSFHSNEFLLIYKNEMNFISSILTFQTTDSTWMNQIQKAKQNYKDMWNGKMDKRDQLMYTIADYSRNELFPNMEEYEEQIGEKHFTNKPKLSQSSVNVNLSKSQSIYSNQNKIHSNNTKIKKRNTWNGSNFEKSLQLPLNNWKKVQKLVEQGQLQVS